jgi:hypothetical protein
MINHFCFYIVHFITILAHYHTLIIKLLLVAIFLVPLPLLTSHFDHLLLPLSSSILPLDVFKKVFLSPQKFGMLKTLLIESVPSLMEVVHIELTDET